MSESFFSEVGIAPGRTEYSDRTIRSGLSYKDRDLPVGQNIKRVYLHTPELGELWKAKGTDNPKTIIDAINNVVREIEKYYGIKVDFVDGGKLLKMTGNPNNKATFNPRNRKIYIANNLSPGEEAEELAHELGAARLIEIYGSKENIPRNLPPLPGIDNESLAATHYLDAYGKTLNPMIIQIARGFK